MLGEQRLEVRLDAVLLQAGIDAQVVGGVVKDLGQGDLQGVAVPAPDLPQRREVSGRRQLGQ